MLILNKHNEDVTEFIPTPEQALDMYKRKAAFVNTDVITIVEDYYDFLVTNSLFYKLDLAYLVISDKSTSADRLLQYKINAINPRKFGLKYYNGPAGNATGIKWTAASHQYANTGFVPSRYRKRMSLNLASAGINQTTNAGNSVDFGTNSKTSTANSFALSSNLGNDAYPAINGSIIFDDTPLTSLGFNCIVRESSTQVKFRHNGALYKTYSSNSTGFANIPILIGALGPTSNNLWSSNEFNHFFLGGMNSTEVAIYETYVNNMQADIETALGLVAGTRKMY